MAGEIRRVTASHPTIASPCCERKAREHTAPRYARAGRSLRCRVAPALGCPAVRLDRGRSSCFQLLSGGGDGVRTLKFPNWNALTNGVPLQWNNFEELTLSALQVRAYARSFVSHHGHRGSDLLFCEHVPLFDTLDEAVVPSVGAELWYLTRYDHLAARIR